MVKEHPIIYNDKYTKISEQLLLKDFPMKLQPMGMERNFPASLWKGNAVLILISNPFWIAFLFLYISSKGEREWIILCRALEKPFNCFCPWIKKYMASFY
jgi:hypothetical protein